MMSSSSPFFSQSKPPSDFELSSGAHDEDYESDFVMAKPAERPVASLGKPAEARTSLFAKTVPEAESAAVKAPASLSLPGLFNA